MKNLILLFSFALAALSVTAQSTGTWNKVNAQDTLRVSGRSIAEIVYVINSLSKNNEIPTAKAVYDYIATLGVAIPEAEIALGNATSDGLTSYPELTFDGDFLHVQGDIDVIHANATVVIDDIAPSSPSQGGTIYLNSKDGAALGDGHRLGGMFLGGSTGVGGTAAGAYIHGLADGAWSGTEAPTMIVFGTTPDGLLDPVDRVRIRQSGDVELLTGKEFRYFDTDNSNYIGLKAPALSTNQTWTLPGDAPANGEVLTWTTGNQLTWETPAVGGTFYQTWKRNGTAATQRANADFLNTTDINITLADNAGNSSTEASFDIPNGAIDLIEMANISTSVLLGNANVAPGPPLEVSLGSQFEINGVTLNLAQNSAASGDVYRWNGSIWAPSADGPGITLGSANQIFGVNNAGTGNEYKTLSGTTNRVTVTHGAGTVTLSGPQDIHTSASPQFSSLLLSNPGGSNNLTLTSSGSQSGINFDAVSPYIYAIDRAPSGANTGMAITFYNNDGAANVAGDRLGVFYFDGRGGSVERTCAQFAAFAEETLTSTSSPGYFSILTTPTGTTTAVERLRIAAGGSTQVRSANALRFYDSDNTNYIGFTAPSLSSDVTLTWPSDAPTNGQQLTWTTGNLLAWEDPGGAGAAFYQTVEVGASPLTQRAKLNFNPTSTISVGNNDDAGNNRTTVEFSVATGSINASHIADGTVGAAEIEDGSIGGADLSQQGATTSQVLTWTGSTWAPASLNDDIFPADITVDVNNYTPTDWAISSQVFVSSDGIHTITGFDDLPGGTVRTIINDGTFPFVIACGHTSSDVANRVVGRGDIIVLPGDGVSMTYNSNNSKWYVTVSGFKPTDLGTTWNGIYYYQQPGSTNQSDHPFLGLAVSGTGATNANATPLSERTNYWELSTGTTAAGVSQVYIPKNAQNFTRTGDGHIVVQSNVFVPTLSTGTQRFTLQVGIIPTANSTTLAVNNSVVVRYKDDVNGGEFELVTRNNAGTETAVDCNVAVAANTMYQITVVLNAARTEARAYINGALAAINTSTMPNAAISVGARSGIFASVGTTAKLLGVGLVAAYVVL